MWRLAIVLTAALHSAHADDWSFYGHDPQGTRYSPLAQITPANVAQLQSAWTYHTGDIADGHHGIRRSGFETTPLLADGRLYLTTPFNRIIALDPATGAELWSYDPKIDKTAAYGDGLINRGAALWRDGHRKGACALRLFEATLDARLVAVDAASGAPCAQFGRAGEVNLRNVANYRAGWYHMTSPPIVVDDVVVVGSAIDDNARAEMPDGVVRGFDARTGKLRWQWAPLQRPAGVPADAWQTGAANAWSILSADPQRHLVYVPTGSASPDYYGVLRPGDNRWANAVVALDTRSGKLAWGFQLVHHDLWDYDTAAPPLVTSFKLRGHRTPALIAGNKTGMIYVLHPGNGKPVLPIEERPVPLSTIAGESAAPTQPFPATLPMLTPRDLPHAWGQTDADRAACEAELVQMSGTSLFTPPSVAGTVNLPGPVGGINWSGFAWDAKREHLIVAITNLAYKVRLIPASKLSEPGNRSGETSAQAGTPFGMTREAFHAPSGLPCTAPPWGGLIALDLATGKIAWRQPVGDMADVWPQAAGSKSGSPILGGPIVTAGGLVFVGGTMDRRLHALSAETGAELWTAELPASAHAQPMTYQIGGKQYVVIAAGGAAKISEETQSDAVMAFALP